MGRPMRRSTRISKEDKAHHETHGMLGAHGGVGHSSAFFIAAGGGSKHISLPSLTRSLHPRSPSLDESYRRTPPKNRALPRLNPSPWRRGRLAATPRRRWPSSACGPSARPPFYQMGAPPSAAAAGADWRIASWTRSWRSFGHGGASGSRQSNALFTLR
jgi:hypothetical protein